MTSSEGLVPTTEVAIKLGYTVQHVRLLCREGNLAAQKVGRDWLVLPSAIEAHLAERDTISYFPREKRGRPRVGPAKTVVMETRTPTYLAASRIAGRGPAGDESIQPRSSYTLPDLTPSILVPQPRVIRSETFTSDADVLLGLNDTLRFLGTVPSGEVDLVISSPPYNIGKPYEKRTELAKYLDWQEQVLRECVRILKPGGSLCWQVGNYVESKEVVPLDILFYPILKEKLGLKLRNRIVWSFEHGLHASSRFSGRYEVVLWFTKTNDYFFNLDNVRVPQKYPGKTYYKGPNRGKPSGNPLGKNPGDVWIQLQQEWEEGIWDIPNVKSNHPEKTLHPAQFPIELVERFVLALTPEQGLVLDPFMGVGSALVAAVLHGRKAAGVDNTNAYVDLAHQRVMAVFNGTLKRRIMGTPKFVPTGYEKVSRVPTEWMRPAPAESTGPLI